MHDLLALIVRLQIRAGLVRVLAGAARGFLAGTVAALALLVLDRAAVPGLALSGPGALAIVGAGIAAFALVAQRHGLTRRDAALAADRAIGTREALAAALEAGDRVLPASPFAALVRDRGERLARGIDASAVVPLGLSRRARRELALGLVFAIAITTGIVAVPRRAPSEERASGTATEPTTTALSAAQMRELNEVADRLEAEGHAEDNWRKLAAADDIAKALRGLESGWLSDAEAARELGRVAGELAEEQRAELARQRAWRELEQQDATHDLAVRIARGENDFASTRARAEAAVRTGEGRRRDMADALSGAARQAAGSGPLEHALERAANALRRGNSESLAEALADAGRDMQPGARGIADGRGHERLESIGKARGAVSDASRSLGGSGEPDRNAEPSGRDGELARVDRGLDAKTSTDRTNHLGRPPEGQTSDGRDREAPTEQFGDGQNGVGEQGVRQKGDGRQADGPEGHGQQTGGQRGDGQRADGQNGDGRQTGGQNGDDQQTGGQKDDAQETGGQKGDGQQTAGQKDGGQKDGGQKDDGQKTSGQKSDEQQAGEQQAGEQKGDGQKGDGQKGDDQKGDGQKGDGQKGDGQQGDEQQGDGQQGDEQQADGQEGDGQQASGQRRNDGATDGPRSDGLASDGHHGGVDSHGSDAAGTNPHLDRQGRDAASSDRRPDDAPDRNADDDRGRHPPVVGPETLYDPDTDPSTFDTLRPTADRGEGPITPQPGDTRGPPSRATSGVDHVRVLPRYLKAVERAQQRQDLPAEFRQRVGRYFDNLGRTPPPPTGSGSGR